MKTKLHILSAIVATLSTPLAFAQEERRPEKPQVSSPERRRTPAAPATRPLAFLGVATSPVPPVLAAQLGLPEGFGLVAEEIAVDSPAEKAGVQRFDVLRLFNDQQLTDPGQLAALVRAQGKDAEVTLTLLRKGQEQKVALRLTERPMPERRPGEMREQIERLKDRAGDKARRMQEQARDLEKRLREYQERIKNWRGAPGEEMPKPPEFHPPAEPAEGRRDERPREREAGRAATRSTATAGKSGRPAPANHTTGCAPCLQALAGLPARPLWARCPAQRVNRARHPCNQGVWPSSPRAFIAKIPPFTRSFAFRRHRSIVFATPGVASLGL